MTRTCEFILATPVPLKCKRGRRGRARMVVGFIATYAISTYHPHVVSSNLDQGEVYNIMR